MATVLGVLMQIESTATDAVKARCKRGVQLAREGKVKKHGDLYIVEGSMGWFYTVNLENINGETCGCKDWKKYGFGHTCKHIIACTIVEAKKRM